MNERELRPDETELVGEWLDTGSRIEGDAVAARIEWLVQESQLELAADESGWSTLYRDLRDGRLWERTHPHSHLARGGPPRLRLITAAAAARKYGVALGE